MTGRFLEYLTSRLPRSGRQILETGEAWNLADWHRFQQRYSLLYQTVENGASVLSVRASGVDISPYYIGLSVPSGRRLVLFFRELAITEGNYNIDVVTAANGFTGGTVGLRAPLKTDAQEIVQSELYAGVTPDGTITERYLGMADTGTSIGEARSGGISGIDGVIQVYTGQPMIRIERLGTETYRTVVRVIAWEEDIPE